MNTENIIEYIRRGVGLKFSKTFFWLEAFSCIVISGGVMMAGMECGGHLAFWGIATFVLDIILIFCTMIFIRKKSPLKNKLIVGAISSCVVTCLFAFFFVSFFENNLVLYYVLMALIPLLLAIFNAFRLNRPTLFFRKKTSIKMISISKVQGQNALGKLILGVIVVCFGNFISEKLFEILLIGTIIFVMCFMPTGLLDLQRYYYFTKLEKLGLVTEDILKPEE